MSDTGSTNTLEDLIGDEIEHTLDSYEERLGQITGSVRDGLIAYHDALALFREATSRAHDRLLWVVWEGEQ